MTLVPDVGRRGRRSAGARPSDTTAARTYPIAVPAAPLPMASQARAARRRAARRDQQAVSAWLRELADRPR
jgi:hypothetical protein